MELRVDDGGDRSGMTPSAGTRLGHCEVLAPIGRGGMGEVFRARDTRIGWEVALKVLSGSACADEERFRRFELEARAAGGGIAGCRHGDGRWLRPGRPYHKAPMRHSVRRS